MNLMKQLLNGHALNVISKTPEKPSKNLGVGKDEKHSSIPILIFTEQHLKQPKPEMPSANSLPFEAVQKPGAGSSLALEDFETQAFYMGHPFGGES